MPTPSLLIVPARFKSGKLYSQIPTSGAGDFTVTRNTAARRFDSAGLIASVASGIPRLDYYTSGGTADCPALLVEPSGTNLALQSENFLTTWSPTNITITTGSTAAFTAPDNSTDADLLTSTTSGSLFVGQSVAIASGTYTISVFGKAGTSHIFSLGNVARNLRGAWFNLNAGAVTGTVNGGTASMQNYGNGWYRCIYTSSGMVSGTNTLIVGLADAANGLTATSGTNLYVWGAQLETGSVATSYIPTTTGSITRNADVVAVSGAVSGSIGQQSGTIYIECQSEFATNDIIVINTAGQSPGNNYVAITKTATNVFRLSLIASGTTILIDQASAITSFAKIAVAYASGNTALFINGTQIGSTDTTGFSFNAALNNITFISNMVSGTKTTRIRAVALYTERLTNDQLASLTTP